ncbi:MAG: hypothetical protein ACRC47_11760 [Shewanella sp.]
MKKVILIAVLSALSFGAVANGGTRGGNVDVNPLELSKQWNGKEGTQQTATNGAIIEWQANERGEMVSRINGGELVCLSTWGGGCYWKK